MKNLKIAIVEDDQEFLEELQEHLNNIPEIQIIGTFTTAQQAIRGLKDSQVEIVIVDIELPQGCGIEVIKTLKPQCPHMSFVVLSVYDSDEMILKAIKAGAVAYLSKEETNMYGIERALKDVAYGGSMLSPTIARKIIEEFKNNKYDKKICKKLESLTPREYEVLKLLSKGYSDKELSKDMKISIYTVRQHIKKIYHKLQINSRTKLIAEYGACVS